MDGDLLFTFQRKSLKIIHSIGIKRIFYSLIFLTICVAGFFGFHTYKKYLIERSINQYLTTLERHIALLETSDEMPLKELAEDASNLSSNKISPLYGHIKALKGFIFQRAASPSNDFLEKAISELEEARNSLSSSNELYQLYSIAQGLLLVSFNQEPYHQQGDIMLKQYIASHDKNLSAATMFFYGWFLLINKGQAEADAIWSPLFKDPKFFHSAYAELAKKANNWEL